MPEFDYSQRKSTPEWDKGYEDLYGKRCVKHPGERKPCKKCNPDAKQVKRIMRKRK